MIHYSKYKKHDPIITGSKKKIDNTIYTFDIETTSYLILDGNVIPAIKYEELTQKEKDRTKKQSCMYIWMFSVEKDVYYGRTWNEFLEFIKIIDESNEFKKTIFVHNLAFEFQYLKSYLSFSEVFARKSHKVMYANCCDYNITFKCTYMMSNVGLEQLPRMFNLPVNKLVGSLDYNRLRHSESILTSEELAYCENDCLVLYYYIKFELATYEKVSNIPNTSTGHVRRELKEKIRQNYTYKNKVKRSINTNPIVYNMLIDAFMGGYTHANWIYTNEILKDIDSYDFTSSYPYVLVTYKYPSGEFKKCNIKSVTDMNKRMAYLIKVRFNKLKCKYFNTFISKSKCHVIDKGKYDNGRVMSADMLEITLTDVDFRFYLDTYEMDSYEILDSYCTTYDYLPIEFIKFVLSKYVLKTTYKGIKEKELEYQIEKQKFNALYGMSVTNNISDRVEYLDDIKQWRETPLTNEEILEGLEKEKKDSFLSFAYGVWVTAHARNNLLRNIIKLDKYLVYADTDSMKLYKGYDKNIINEYNNKVKKRIEFTSKMLGINIDKFAPLDKKGVPHMLGLFEFEQESKNYPHTYEEFITQGSKKYAYKVDNEIHITVAGVPKKRGAKALKSLKDFKDDFVFKSSDTGKQMLFYAENQQSIKMKDFQNKSYKVTDISGCCLVPDSYTLGKALDYAELVSDESSPRSIYKI